MVSFVLKFSEQDYIKPLQTQSVMRLIFDWLMVQQLTLDEWRYVSMECGAQYVMTTGMSEMYRWCADNWDMLQVSYSCQNVKICYMILYY